MPDPFDALLVKPDLAVVQVHLSVELDLLGVHVVDLLLQFAEAIHLTGQKTGTLFQVIVHRRFFGLQGIDLFIDPGAFLLKRTDLAFGQLDFQAFKIFELLLIFTGFVGLTLDGTDLPADFDDDVIKTQQIVLGVL